MYRLCTGRVVITRPPTVFPEWFFLKKSVNHLGRNLGTQTPVIDCIGLFCVSWLYTKFCMFLLCGMFVRLSMVDRKAVNKERHCVKSRHGVPTLGRACHVPPSGLTLSRSCCTLAYRVSQVARHDLVRTRLYCRRLHIGLFYVYV
jgi:hypothetical protein